MPAKGAFNTSSAVKHPMTIVLVDDNDDVREVTSLLLSRLGYDVIGADCGAAALNLLETGRTVDLLMVDFVLPDMSGVELSAKARSGRPELKVVFITGYADSSSFRDQVGDETVIQKPFTANQLESVLSRALNSDGVGRAQRVESKTG
jgi:CheY-like chemotaxis protein